MAQLKINLDLDAVKQLFGGTDAVSVELRAAAVQEFAKTHLKAVVATEQFQTEVRRTEELVRDEFARAANKYFEKDRYNAIPNGLTGQSRNLIREHVEALFYTQVRDAVNEAVAKAVSEIDAAIERRVSEAVADEVNRRVAAKLNAAFAAVKAK